jgi:hypothetical protein
MHSYRTYAASLRSLKVDVSHTAALPAGFFPLQYDVGLQAPEPLVPTLAPESKVEGSIGPQERCEEQHAQPSRGAH